MTHSFPTRRSSELPVFGEGFAALMLYFIKTKILYAEDRLAAANKWVHVLIALMAGAFMAYMSLKGLRQIWRPSMPEIAFFSGLAFALAYALDRKSTRLNSSH